MIPSPIHIPNRKPDAYSPHRTYAQRFRSPAQELID